ncbi:MAG: heavy metal translocating P-type ATPase [Pirellulaceae bacterium]|nr:heavy metal translocating P-type ATPase [Pirellulaceae bacterium]
MRFRIAGMDCAEEVAILKRELGSLAGGEDRLAFDILNRKMTVTPSGGSLSAEQVQQVVARTGMRADIWNESQETAGETTFWQLRGRTILTAASGIFLALGFLAHLAYFGLSEAIGLQGESGHSMPDLAKVLYGVSALAGAWFFFPKAWFAAKSLRPDMNLLMVVAVAGAIGIGEWFEGATVAFLFAVSLAIESWSVGRARRAIAALMELAPTLVRVIRVDGKEESLAPDQVPPGTAFFVRPGERFPLDGKVVEGMSDVNQAPITGESVPVPKVPGDEVFAGTINGDGGTLVVSTKAVQDTTLSRIIRMVGAAQSRRAPSEQWVEQFAKYYTPAVLVLALAVLLLSPLIFSIPWSQSLYNSLVLLVIACPCALVISTPVSIVAALAAAAKEGVLVKGGLYIEMPARLKAIAMDKTGTLTEGKPAVTEVVPLNGHDEKELLERAAALEVNSDHPLARAIVAYAKGKGIQPLPAEEFKILQGKGAIARFDGRPFWLGSHRYLEERGQETPDVHQRLEEMSKAGRSVVVVGNDQHVCGLIALADQIRPSASQTISDLHELGIAHLIMLTGDNEPTARAIAAEIGIDVFRSELLPEDKVAAMEALVQKYGFVAMVGDGVNDAPALARASLAIAMGAAGSDAAIETADIALMSDDLSRIPWLIRHSKRTGAIIRQNIGASLAIKAAIALLAFSGYASLWAAIAADIGVSLAVILNSLRLLRK